MKTTTRQVEFAPFRELANGGMINSWNGWEVRDPEDNIIGYCCKVMHHRTPRWHITCSKPKHNSESSVIDMTQFICDGELNLGYKTLKEAKSILIDTYLNNITAANNGQYGRNK